MNGKAPHRIMYVGGPKNIKKEKEEEGKETK